MRTFTFISYINGLDGEPYAVSVIENEKQISIPMDSANTDYQEYLKWVAEGNTPEPAEGTE